MKFVRIVVGLVIIAALVVFALGNRAAVTLAFLGYELSAPLSVAILVAAAIAFLVGALTTWFGELRQRRRARRAEHRVAQLERELERLAPPVPRRDVAIAAPATAPTPAPATATVLPAGSAPRG